MLYYEPILINPIYVINNIFIKGRVNIFSAIGSPEIRFYNFINNYNYYSDSKYFRKRGFNVVYRVFVIFNIKYKNIINIL